MSWYKPETTQEKLLNSLLSPLSAFYKLGSLSRLKGYENKILTQKRLSAPVISIGNLTVGGTGKTPITIDLAKGLQRFGLKVGILSRGYKRRSSEKVLVVSDGRQILVDSAQAGDEPFLIAQSVPGAVVIVSADRYAAGQMAIKDYACDILILDDGFQHLKLYRDFDILVYDYNDDLEDLKLLPAGRLREPITSIARADCIVISKLPDNPDPRKIQQLRVKANQFRPGIPVLSCRFETDGLHRVYNSQKVTITTRGDGVRVFAFCGIARPEGFIKQLYSAGCVVAGKQTYPDHHWLTAQELDKLARDFEESGAQFLVTTAKDRVRLPEEFIDKVPLAELSLSTSWSGVELTDLQELRAILKKMKNSSKLPAGAAR